MMSEQTNHDSTIDEIHRTREQMAAKFGHDIAAILADAQKRQEASGRAIWRGPLPMQEATTKVDVAGVE
jgi:hypothetical protein